MSDKPKLIIDCEKWRRGGYHSQELLDEFGPTLLLNGKGYMCCLGFDCVQNREKSTDDILGYGTPCSIKIHEPFDPEAMNINDDPYISDTDRMAALTKLLSPYRDVEFINIPEMEAKPDGQE